MNFFILIWAERRKAMLGTIILWLVTIFNIIWTINWIVHRGSSRGHFWAVVEVVLMWILVIYFFLHPDIPRFHLIWAAPVAFFIGYMISGVFMRLSREVWKWNRQLVWKHGTQNGLHSWRGLVKWPIKYSVSFKSESEIEFNEIASHPYPTTGVFSFAY